MTNNQLFSRTSTYVAATTLALVASATAALAVGGDDPARGADARSAAVVAVERKAPTPPVAPAVDQPTKPRAKPRTKPPVEATYDGPSRDDDRRADFPGPDRAVFVDGSSATSDGTSLLVETDAGERLTVALPADAEGWISQVLVDLGDAGVGYLVTQSGGEYIQTSLAVLHDGELTLADVRGDVPFGSAYSEQEGTAYETFTSGDGARLLTQVRDDLYEWTVEGTTLVPTAVPSS